MQAATWAVAGARRAEPSAWRAAVRPAPAPAPAGLGLRRCACGGSCPRCQASAAQPELAVNAPGDAFEREADAAAEAVMAASPASVAKAAPPALRRCACGGSCPSCRKEKEAELHRKETGGGSPGVAPPLVHEVLSSPGRPLPVPAKTFMEQRFGTDFSGVRVHDDARAAESSRAVDAHAYAVGSDLVFDAGRYAPGTSAGDRLIAHELAHVVQQGGTPAPAVAPRALAPYRASSAPHFQECDGGGLVEKEYERGDPWIDQISVNFDDFTRYVDDDVMPKGKLSATYADGTAAVTDMEISGGYASLGLTDRGDFKVLRIEGCGYHSITVPRPDRSPESKKYYAPSKLADANMSYAIFFRQGKSSGNQAIHRGLITAGSLACVHVQEEDQLRRLNYHSRVKHTKVSVAYTPSVLAAACCARRAFTGRMVSNPCGDVDAASCP